MIGEYRNQRTMLPRGNCGGLERTARWACSEGGRSVSGEKVQGCGRCGGPGAWRFGSGVGGGGTCRGVGAAFAFCFVVCFQTQRETVDTERNRYTWSILEIREQILRQSLKKGDLENGRYCNVALAKSNTVGSTRMRIR